MGRMLRLRWRRSKTALVGVALGMAGGAAVVASGPVAGVAVVVLVVAVVQR